MFDVQIEMLTCMSVSYKPRPSKSQQPVADQEKEWREKLFGECENDFFESFGVYEGTFDFYFIRLLDIRSTLIINK